MNIENVLSELEDQGLTDDEIGLVEEVTSFEKKQLKSKLNELNKILNYIEAAGYILARKDGSKRKVAKFRKPKWKKRIKDKVNLLRTDVTFSLD